MTTFTKILYAEDDLDIQKITLMTFQGSAYILEVCNSGREVIDKVEDFKPDLILLDVMMPEVDGITAYHKLKESETTKKIPVIFMTAKVNTKEVEKYYSIGAIGVIFKPFDPCTLEKEIQTLYRQHWEKNEARQ